MKEMENSEFRCCVMPVDHWLDNLLFNFYFFIRCTFQNQMHDVIVQGSVRLVFYNTVRTKSPLKVISTEEAKISGWPSVLIEPSFLVK